MPGPARTTRSSGVSLLLTSGAVALLLGGLLALLGAVGSGSAAAYGALVGTALVVVIGTGGVLLVHAVAGVLPSASLLVALLTYTLQVLLLVVAFLALERSGWLTSDLDRAWVGGAAIVATFQWLLAQLLLTVRSRVPAWDPRPEGGEG